MTDVGVLATPLSSELDRTSLFDFVVELGPVLVRQLQRDFLGTQFGLRVEEGVVLDHDGEVVVVLVFDDLGHDVLLVVGKDFWRYVVLQSWPNNALCF